MSANSSISRRSAAGDFVVYLRLIRFSHTVFALPFAAIGAVLAARGIPGAWTCAWVLVAMVAARSAAMGFNRAIDADIDARNPRTQNREIPIGRIRKGTVIALSVFFAGLFVLAAAMLNSVAFALSPVVLVVVIGYSFTKRFTYLSHVVLGLSLGLAPLGAWVAVLGARCLDGVHVPLLLASSVVTWVAGFDILYSCMDIEFDRKTRLHSIPQRFGLVRALRISAGLHAIMVGLLAILLAITPTGPLFPIAVAAVAILLFQEHRIIGSDDLSRVNQAFFTLNGIVGMVLMVACLADHLAFGRVP